MFFYEEDRNEMKMMKKVIDDLSVRLSMKSIGDGIVDKELIEWQGVNLEIMRGLKEIAKAQENNMFHLQEMMNKMNKLVTVVKKNMGNKPKKGKE